MKVDMHCSKKRQLTGKTVHPQINENQEILTYKPPRNKFLTHIKCTAGNKQVFYKHFWNLPAKLTFFKISFGIYVNNSVTLTAHKCQIFIYIFHHFPIQQLISYISFLLLSVAFSASTVKVVQSQFFSCSCSQMFTYQSLHHEFHINITPKKGLKQVVKFYLQSYPAMKFCLLCFSKFNYQSWRHHFPLQVIKYSNTKRRWKEGKAQHSGEKVEKVFKFLFPFM